MLQKGKLFLASEGRHPDSLEKLEKFVGDFKNKTIGYCVTARTAECGFGSWKSSKTLKIIKKLGAKITIIELENFYKEDVISKFKNKDIIWMAGGMPGYLLYWLRRLELEKLIPDLLTKGSIYVGSSAGGMVCGPTNYASELFFGDEEIGGAIFPGLSFVDFEIWPHYQEEHLPMLKEKWHHGKLCLLKNGEAITIVDGKMEILGEEGFIS